MRYLLTTILCIAFLVTPAMSNGAGESEVIVIGESIPPNTDWLVNQLSEDPDLREELETLLNGSSVVNYYSSGGGSHMSDSTFKRRWYEVYGEVSDVDEPPQKPKLNNMYVTPDSGNWSDEFTYVVDFNSENTSRVQLTLEVYKPGSDSWDELEKEVAPYMYDQHHNAKVEFKYSDFTPVDVGNTSKFKVSYKDGYNDNDEEPWDETGPGITKPNITFKKGDNFIDDVTWHQYCDYVVDVDHSGGEGMKLDLEVFLPGVGEWWPAGEKRIYRYDNCTAKAAWRQLNFFSIEDVNKASKFRINYVDNVGNEGSVCFDGPNIVNHEPQVIDAWAEPKDGTCLDSFDYHVKLQDVDDDDVTLTFILKDANKTIEEITRVVSSSDIGSENGTEFMLPSIKFGEDYSNKNLSFSLICDDKVVKTSSKLFDGPNIRGLPEITVGVLPISHEGRWWDTYTLQINVANPSDDPVEVRPVIYSSNGKINLDYKSVPPKTEVLQTLSWDLNEFNVNDRNENITYGFEYNLRDDLGLNYREASLSISDQLIPSHWALINFLGILALSAITFQFSVPLLNKLRKSKFGKTYIWRQEKLE